MRATTLRHPAMRRPLVVLVALLIASAPAICQEANSIGAAVEATGGAVQHTAAQVPVPTPAQEIPPPAAPATTPPAASASTLPTVAELTAQRQADAQDAELDEATRMALDQQYQKAIDNLQTAEQHDRKLAALAKELEQAPQLVTDFQERLNKPPATDPAIATTDIAGVDAVSAKLKEAEGLAAAKRQDLQGIKAEIERRNARRSQLPELKTQIEQQLQQVAQDLTAAPPADENPRVTAVRLQRLQTKQHRLRREQALLDQEARTYEGAARSLVLQQDVMDRDARDADKTVQFWQQRLADEQRRQAQAEAKAARRKQAQSHESVRTQAERNTELADENARLVNAMRDARAKLNDIKGQLESHEDAFESLEERANAANFSPAIGVLLRNRQGSLPDLDDIRLEVDARQAEIDDLSLKITEWEAERKPLLDIPAETDDVIAKLDSIPESISIDDLKEQVQSLLTARSNLLRDLKSSGEDLLELLVEINTEQNQFIKTVDEEANWLAEHVLWVRSTGMIGTQPRMFLTSAAQLLDERAWKNVGRLLLLDLSESWGWWAAGAIGGLVLLVLRGRAKRRLKQLGEIAERASCIDILPTVETVLLTLLIAAPGPLLVFLLGLRISEIARSDDLLQALGTGIEFMAATWGAIALVRQVAQSHGLADAHFGWPRPALAALRKTTRFLSVALLPFVFVVAFTEDMGDVDTVSTIGRIAYLCGMGCFALSMFRLLRPSSQTLQALKTTEAGGLLYRSRGLWTALFLALPIVLAALSAAGYHYTAVQFTGRAAATVGCALLILLVTAFLHRWLLLTYRNLAIRRGRERREQLLQAAQNDPEQALPAEATPELTLVDINAQSRRMLRIASLVSSVIALYLIWVDVLPALGFLRNIELWPLAETAEDAAPQWITAADLLNAILIGALTLLASRNLPGMMEISILQRLPMDAGARYAATTVSRYLIVVTGIVLGFSAIGIGWSSVQWLVAAMTVGLGFGLQEIFANFVSGIILLFERPMRVGDVVTIGDSSGTVTRIQIRATTILNFDHKELVVPNREFVTGNLTNWTLSSPTLRIVIKVGIAYGSDTKLATDLLLQAAAENPLVLEDPPPFAIFTGFGASSLDYELRLYVSGLRNFGRAQHEMHIAIDELFRKHNIEIAFPQQDLHVRSLPDDLIRQLTRTAAKLRSQEADDHLGAA